MDWTVSTGRPAATAADLLVVGVARTERGPDFSRLAELDRAAGGVLGGLADGRVFGAQAESVLLVPGGGCAAPWLLLVGLGPAADLSLQRLRRCAGVAATQARRVRAARCAVVLPELPPRDFEPRAAARAWVEGVELSLDRPERFRGVPAQISEEGEEDERVAFRPGAWSLLERSRERVAAMTRGLDEGRAYAAGTLWARRAVNLPPNILTPVRLAAQAREIARADGYAFRSFGPAQLEKMEMNGLLAVARGSACQPRLIVLETPVAGGPAPGGRARRRVRDRRPLVALVGKGLTFDSGGISLKPPKSMEVMKNDMGGAAAVLGAARIVARLGLPVRLLVVVPAAENMPDGSALRPGEVITTAAGRTVEVLNTDAEGRLVLADALHYACAREPDWLIDVATLTGSCSIALGEHFAGVLGNDERLLETLERAGGDTFERVWPLPLIDEHRRLLSSDVADCKNVGGRDGGALTAAAFLSLFVADSVAWAHVDMAGPVWTDTAGPLGPRGATGYGARLLARTVQILAQR